MIIRKPINQHQREKYPYPHIKAITKMYSTGTTFSDENENNNNLHNFVWNAEKSQIKKISFKII